MCLTSNLCLNNILVYKRKTILISYAYMSLATCNLANWLPFGVLTTNACNLRDSSNTNIDQSLFLIRNEKNTVSVRQSQAFETSFYYPSVKFSTVCFCQLSWLSGPPPPLASFWCSFEWLAAMGRAPCCDKSRVKKGPWSPEEDTTLKNYLHKHGSGGNWIVLPTKAGKTHTLFLTDHQLFRSQQ